MMKIKVVFLYILALFSISLMASAQNSTTINEEFRNKGKVYELMSTSGSSGIIKTLSEASYGILDNAVFEARSHENLDGSDKFFYVYLAFGDGQLGIDQYVYIDIDEIPEIVNFMNYVIDGIDISKIEHESKYYYTSRNGLVISSNYEFERNFHGTQLGTKMTHRLSLYISRYAIPLLHTPSMKQFIKMRDFLTSVPLIVSSNS